MQEQKVYTYAVNSFRDRVLCLERRFLSCPYGSPARYLPLVYLLPYELLTRFLTLHRLPRSMGKLNASPEWDKVILSQQFFNETKDAVASLVFPHFGFGG